MGAVCGFVDHYTEHRSGKIAIPDVARGGRFLIEKNLRNICWWRIAIVQTTVFLLLTCNRTPALADISEATIWSSVATTFSSAFSISRPGPAASKSFKANVTSINPQLFSGQFSYSIPLPSPAPRQKFGPKLTVQYSSGSGQGIAGLGWTIPISSVKRNLNNGIDYNGNDFVYSDVDFSSNIAQISDGTYRAIVDRPNFRYTKIIAADGLPMWLAEDSNGGKMYFGETSDSRIYVPTNSAQIFSWNISRAVDPLGTQ